MGDLADLLANDPHSRPRKAKASHPTGWEPHVVEAGTTAQVVTQPTANNPDHVTLLEDSGLDPALWQIDGDVQVRRWQQKEDGEWLRYFKFTASRASAPSTDVAALCKKISRHRSKPPTPRDVDVARIVCLADWQAGKGEGGGSEALVERVLSMIDTVTAMLRAEKPPLLVVAGLGDMVEGCTGHYDMQTFSVDLDRRQQEKLVRRLLVKALTAWAPLVPKMVVTCVPGNHGENRRQGKAYTTFGDNGDVAAFEQAAEVLRANPDAYGHVRFVIPDDELVVTLDVAGLIMAFAHGHQFRSGTTPQAKAFGWWRGQALGNRPAGDASVLVSGHYHHLCHVNGYGRTWLQAPSLDGGSKWFTTTSGQHDAPGTLTFTVTADGPDHVRIVT